jgi:hydroxymethylbilane synthase
MKHIRIASRGSRLALAQADIVKDALLRFYPDLQVSVVKVVTKGDRDKSEFLYKAQSIGFFSSEVETALLDGRADLAVHSLKDLPTTPTPGLLVAAVTERQRPADALLTSIPASSIDALPQGASVGTSSLRRIAQLHHLRPDLNCVPLRGNIETRIRKLSEHRIDAVIIACAGLYRLGLADKITAVLPPEQFLPAPGQGALAVQARENDIEIIELASKIDHKPTRIATEAERLVLAAMKGGCSIPLGAYAKITENRIEIHAMIADIDGKNLIRRTKSSTLEHYQNCAAELAEELLQSGGKEILNWLKKES